MEKCRCTQAVGLHHNPVCRLVGLVGPGNILPPGGPHHPPQQKTPPPLSFTLANQITLHTVIERLMYEEDQEVLHVVPHSIHPGSTRNLYPLNVEQYKIIHRARH